MKNCRVIEINTKVTLVLASYDFCHNWIINNCVKDEATGYWLDYDNEPVMISIPEAED